MRRDRGKAVVWREAAKVDPHGVSRGLRLGIDLGGTTISAVVIGPGGQVFGAAHGSTGECQAEKDVLDRVTDIACHAIADAGIKPTELETAGIGLPGEVDTVLGELRASPILAKWSNVAVARLLEQRLGIQFAVENDANAALMGEYAFGAARGTNASVMLTIGTGIGGAVLIEGRIWRGKRGSAGELGHICVDPNGPPCWCGQLGCLGVLASTTALVRRFKEIQGDLLNDRVDGRYVAERFNEGNIAAKLAVNEISAFLARGILAAACVVAPDRVILHGGIMAGLAAPLLEGVRQCISNRSYPAVLSSLEVVAAALGINAGAIGAAIIPDFAGE